ncbi:Hypothetical predicted protein [Mytilus galloprovincialis]|uniref:Uncharacterized protein n=1 Tax=Mytilus galloprovincialis TaxID=29158 RepID=A0A8B6F2L8_MYTGA|nr:Hypothetical predicted protein [Mytilus galloprovincialis]
MILNKTTLSELSKVVHSEIRSNDQSIISLVGTETDETNLSQNVKLMKENATNMQILVGIQAIETSLVSAKRTLDTSRKEGNTHKIISLNIKDESTNAFDLLPYSCGSYSCKAIYDDHHYYIKTQTSIMCCDIKGNVLWSFEDTNILKEPRCIVADKNENIFVVGGHSENIVVI